MATGEDLVTSGTELANGRVDGAGGVPLRDSGDRIPKPRGRRGKVSEIEAGEPRRVEMVDGAESASSQWDTTASLKIRFLRVQRDVETLTKDADIKGTTKAGGTFSYKGISSAQVVARAKSALITHGVLYTAEIETESVKIDGNKTKLVVVGTFENVDSDEKKIVRMWGEGTDNADNGHAKAFTSGNKQILLKQLNLTTVEDEKTHEIEHETKPRTAAVRDAEAQADVAVKQWADAFRDALRGAKTAKELARIRAENSDMMKRVPDATREYFADMIASLEGMLE